MIYSAFVLTLALLRSHEGLRLSPYVDSRGSPAVGYGHTRTLTPVTRSRAEILLRQDLAHVDAALRARLPWFDDLSPVRQAVLLDMGYNLGVEGLLRFRRTLAAVEAQRWDVAAASMLRTPWARQVGLRARCLSWMMRTGRVFSSPHHPH